MSSTNYWHASATEKQRKDTKFWKDELKTYLSISKEGVPVDNLNELLDNDGVGQIPYKKLGFLHLNHFLSECHDFLLIGKYYNNQLFLFTKQAEVAPEVAHIAQLVKGQERSKGSNKNPRPLRHQITSWLEVREILRHSIRNDNARDYQPPPKHFPRKRRGRGGRPSSKYPAFSAPRFERFTNQRARFSARNDSNSEDNMDEEMDRWDFGGSFQTSQSKAGNDDEWTPVQSNIKPSTPAQSNPLLRNPFHKSSNATSRSTNPLMSVNVPIKRPVMASSNYWPSSHCPEKSSGQSISQTDGNAGKIYFPEKTPGQQMANYVTNQNQSKICVPERSSGPSISQVDGNAGKIYFPQKTSAQQMANHVTTNHNQGKIYVPEKWTGQTVSQITDANQGKIYFPEKKHSTSTQQNKPVQNQKAVKPSEQSLVPSLIPSLNNTLSKLIVQPSIIPSLNNTLAKIDVSPSPVENQMQRSSVDNLSTSNPSPSTNFPAQPLSSKRVPEVTVVKTPPIDNILSASQLEPHRRPAEPRCVKTLENDNLTSAVGFGTVRDNGSTASVHIQSPKRLSDLMMNITNDRRKVKLPYAFTDAARSNERKNNYFITSSTKNNSIQRPNQLSVSAVNITKDSRNMQMSSSAPTDSACASGNDYNFNSSTDNNITVSITDDSANDATNVIGVGKLRSTGHHKSARDNVVERILRDPRGEDQKENILRSPNLPNAIYNRQNINTINSDNIRRFSAVNRIDTKPAFARKNDDGEDDSLSQKSAHLKETIVKVARYPESSSVYKNQSSSSSFSSSLTKENAPNTVRNQHIVEKVARHMDEQLLSRFLEEMPVPVSSAVANRKVPDVENLPLSRSIGVIAVESNAASNDVRSASSLNANKEDISIGQRPVVDVRRAEVLKERDTDDDASFTSSRSPIVPQGILKCKFDDSIDGVAARFKTLTFSTNNMYKQDVPNSPKYDDHPLGSMIMCKISEVVSSQNVTNQSIAHNFVISHKNVEELNEIEQEMEGLYQEDVEFWKVPGSLMPNGCYGVFIHEWKKWVRCQVRRPPMSNIKKFPVKLYDYCLIKLVAREDIRYTTKKIHSLPQHSYRAILDSSCHATIEQLPRAVGKLMTFFVTNVTEDTATDNQILTLKVANTKKWDLIIGGDE